MHVRRLFKDLFGRAPAIPDVIANLDPRAPLPEPQAKKANVVTLVSVVFSTAAKTFDGPAVYVTAGSPVRTTPRVLPTLSSDDDDDVASTTHLSSTPRPSTTRALTSSTPKISSPVVPPVTPQPTPPPVPANAATTTAAASSGMSGGAKAGLAFGIIALLGVAFAGGFLLYRRRQRKHEDHERLDDEKGFMSYPDSLPSHPEPTQSATSAITRRTTQDSAPRLSLRPVTEFHPSLGPDGRNASPQMHMSEKNASATVAAATAAAAASQVLTPGTQPKLSAWEKPGASHANDPANPFGNHAETLGASPPRDAALLSANSTAPSSPPRTVVKEIDAADFPLPDSMPSTPRMVNVPDSAKSGIPSPALTDVSVPSSLAASGAAAAGVASSNMNGGAAIGAGKRHSPQGSPEAVHRVQLDFKPSMDDELNVRAGQLVRLLHEYDDGWVLCIHMDRSQQGVVPRSVLSKFPIKPRPTNPQQRPGPRNGPPPVRGPGPNGPPPPFAQPPRPLTPGGSGRNSPVPQHSGPPQTPGSQSPRPQSPIAPYMQQAGRPRANSSASPYQAYSPNGRSASPGPHSGSGLRPNMSGPGGPGGPGLARKRSNSTSQVPSALRKVAPSSKIPAPIGQIPARKPVPGSPSPAQPAQPAEPAEPAQSS